MLNLLVEIVVSDKLRAFYDDTLLQVNDVDYHRHEQ